MTDDEHQRLVLAVLMAAHDLDERRFMALLAGLAPPELRMLVRQLAEGLVGWQSAAEARPGDARDRLAETALELAGR
jgi:hypothetical protein